MHRADGQGMNLESYLTGRLVVLKSDASAYDASRAMLANRIGTVLVVEGARLEGIVTDRDIALRVGPRLRLDQVPLRDVMTPHPVCIDVGRQPEQAAAAMISRRIRRLVVVVAGSPRGIVTLDDLIMSKAVSRETLRKLVMVQLKESAPSKPDGQTRPDHLHGATPKAAKRRAAHRDQSVHVLAGKLRKITGLHDEADALAAFEIFATNLVRRLTADEASDFVAQLPANVRDALPLRLAGPDRRVSRASIERDIARRLGIAPESATELVWRMGQHLGDLVSEGEVRDLASQLPKDLGAIIRRAA